MSEPRVPDLTLSELPPEYLNAIGLVTVRYAAAEMMLTQALHALAKLGTETGHAFTAHMVTPLRLDALLILAKLRLHNNPALLFEAEQIVGDFRSAATSRGDIVHSAWSYERTTNSVHKATISARGVLKASLDEYSVERITAVVDEVTALLNRITIFHLVALPPVPFGEISTNTALFTRYRRMRYAAIDRRYQAHLAAEKEAKDNKARKQAHAEASRRHPSNSPKKT
jgi:hypothetical protein